MQEELAQNVEELEDSKQKLEKTVADLQVAKEKERRLATRLRNLDMTFGMLTAPFPALPHCCLKSWTKTELRLWMLYKLLRISAE